MKQTITIIALAFFSLNALAQSKSNEGVKFGVRAGVNLASVGVSGNIVSQQIKDAVKSVTSYSFGGYASIPVSAKFSIQPGLNISGKGSKVVSVPLGVNAEVNVMYLELPVNAVVKFNGFYFGGGPYLGYALAGK